MKRARARERPLPPPRKVAFANLGPYAQTQLTVRALGQELALDVPYGVFSTQRIDEGTQLLLAHLPEQPPRTLLEIGCGYGALALPICARFRDAKALLVDRDLVAVKACEHNSLQFHLYPNVAVRPGLGFRDVPRGARFDWILCNVPARIGQAFIAHLLVAGQALLAEGGELRVVVIRDLEPLVEGVAVQGLQQVIRGPRHSVYSIPAIAGATLPALDDLSVYARDQTSLDGVLLSRPHDASEDPRHGDGLQALVDALPRTPPKRALSFRCGYGALPAVLRRRFPEAEVVGNDADLLLAAFARLNAPGAQILETLWPAGGPADLIVAELSSRAGGGVAAEELKQLASALRPGGQALVLLTARQERDWLPLALPAGSAASTLLRRDDFSVVRLGPILRR